MNIVLDANIVIAALMGSRGTLTIITSQHYNFYAPRFIIDEIRKYKQFICEHSGQTTEEFEINFEALLVFINVLDYIEYETHMEKAKRAIEERDQKDAPYIACALATNADFIWTNDKDFTDQDIVQTKTTDQFIEENR